jgi:2-isopropylmalate synthase
MHPEFGRIVQKAAESSGTELTSSAIMQLFKEAYLTVSAPYKLKKHQLSETAIDAGTSLVVFNGSCLRYGTEFDIRGEGNGPIDAFFSAIKTIGIDGYKFISYHEHAASSGANAQAVAYIELEAPNGVHYFGVGTHSNINVASMKAILCAINRQLLEARS